MMIAILALAACNPPEHPAGPGLYDHDGDGLVDAEELVLGTDPRSADSDGDGFDDRHEVRVSHTNPNFAWSRPYDTPYAVGACDVDVLPDPDLAGPTGPEHATYPAGPTYQPGDLVENLAVDTVHGETLHLWSLCGRVVILSLGSEGCSSCWTGFAEKADPWMDDDPNLTFIPALYGKRGYTEPAIEAADDRFGFPDDVPLGVTRGWGAAFQLDKYIPENVLIGPDMRVIAVDRPIPTQYQRWVDEAAR